MGLTTLSGAVSGIRHSTETRGTVGRNGGSVKTGQVFSQAAPLLGREFVG